MTGGTAPATFWKVHRIGDHWRRYGNYRCFRALREPALGGGILQRNQLRSGGGPARVRISPHKLMFRRADLDAWMASWQFIEASR